MSEPDDDAPTLDADGDADATAEVPAGGSPDPVELEHEVEELTAENEALKERLADKGHRGRRATAVVLVVVASLLVPVSLLGVWLDRTATDTDRYVETVAPLARDQAIQDAAANRITTTLFDNLDVQARVATALPDQAQFLAAPIAGSLESLADRLTREVLASDQFAKAWDAANRAAHSQLRDVLTTSNGKAGVVQVDLSPVLKDVVSRLDARGITTFDAVANRPVELTVFQSQDIAKVQAAFNVFDKVAKVLPWITLLLLVAAVFVHPNRRRGLVWASGGVAVASVGFLLTLALGRQVYVGALPAGASVAAATSIFDTLLRFLKDGTRLVLTVSLLVLIGALVMGPSGPAVRLRAGISSLLGRAGSGVEHRGALAGVAGFTARNAMALRVAIGVVAAIVLVAMDRPTGAAVLILVLLGLVALAVVEVLARAGHGLPTSPTGPTEPPVTGPPAVAADTTADAG